MLLGLKIGATAALIGLIYGRVLVDLADDWWNEPSLSQGLLAPPLALFIAWLRRASTLGKPAVPDNRGLLAIGLACLVFLLGKIGAEFFLQRISLVILLAGLLWTFWGLGRTRTLVFPLLLLATMVPLPVIFYNAISAPLKLFASGVSTGLAQALGVSVYRDGNIIHLAGISLGVEEACSGLNSLTSLVVSSLLLGLLQCSRMLSRALLVAFSIPLSIGVNIVRISGTAVLADYHEQFALGFYHFFSGWFVFVIGFGLLYLSSLTLHLLFE